MVEDYTEAKYKSVNKSCDGLCLVQDFNDLFGYIDDETGEEKIPCQFPEAYDFSEGRALVKDFSNNWFGVSNFIDKEGHVILHLGYKDWIGSFHCGRVNYADSDGYNNSYGYLDDNGKRLLVSDSMRPADFHDDVTIIFPKGRDAFAIGVDGNRLFFLPRGHFFKKDAVYYAGVAPIVIYGGPEDSYYSRDAFVDKKGKVYSDPSEVKRLQALYNAAKNAELNAPDKATYPPEKLIRYCSKIHFMGQDVVLKADTPEELLRMKGEYYQQLENDLGDLVSHITTLNTQNKQEQRLFRHKPEQVDGK